MINLFFSEREIYKYPIPQFADYRFTVEISARGIVKRGKKVVLQHMKKAGQYKLPGGRIEVGETPVQAFVREVSEETGFSITRIKAIGNTTEIRTPPAEKLGKIFISYIFSADFDSIVQKPTLEEDEVRDGLTPIWVTRQEAIELIDSSKRIDYVSEFVFTRDKGILAMEEV